MVANWSKISSVNISVTDFVMDINDSGIIYLGSNAVFNTYEGIKSLDGGKTWTKINNVPKIINPHNTKILYTTGTSGIRKSSDGGTSWTNLNGDWKSCGAVALATHQPQVLYAYCEGGSSSGIFKSENAGSD